MSTSVRPTISNADGSLVRSFLERASKRLAAIAFLEGAAGGVIVAALLLLLGAGRSGIVVTAVVVVAAVAVGAAVRWAMQSRERREAALTVERAASSRCHNLVVAADEILVNPERVRDNMASLVFRQAANVVRALDIAELFPARKALLWLCGTSLALVTVVVLQNTTIARTLSGARGPAISVPVLSGVELKVTSPPYAKRADKSVRDPSRIEALAGSSVSLVVRSNASTVIIETIEGTDTLKSNGDETFTGQIVASADGFIAIEPSNSVGKGTRKMIGLSVTPDRAPRVRLTAPAKDQMFPDGNRTLSIVGESTDDIALASFKLRYTKVSGSGERFSFTEGEVPLSITRDSDLSWKGQVKWNLSSLELEAGDMVVYRAVVTDNRPGSPPVESDSYIAEVKLDGLDAAAGFSVDPDQDRYALSQQMIIVKTERLLAKRASMTSEAFANEAAEIAVEQRRVRAEFVFMMGGELEDAPLPDADMTVLHEEEEAESEGDILDGRGANRGRKALVNAVRHMSNAAQLLVEGDAVSALPREKTALKELEQAFAHTRILLRALSQAEKLDMTRRMTGPLEEVGRDVRPVPVAENAVRVVALRSVLAGIAELQGSDTVSNANQRASELAERVLRVDPSAKPLQEIANSLNEAAAAFGKRDVRAAKESLGRASVALTATLRNDLIASPKSSRSLDVDRLDGALADALRKTRGKR